MCMELAAKVFKSRLKTFCLWINLITSLIMTGRQLKFKVRSFTATSGLSPVQTERVDAQSD